MDYFFRILASLVNGMGNTVSLFLLTIVISLPVGFLFSLCSISKVRPARWIVNVYVMIMRGTPLMLQILFLYFGLIFAGIALPKYAAGLLALSLNYSAYFSEIFRGGIQSIERGQFEAADVLGLTHGQTMRRVVLPQVIKRTMPSIGNEVVNLVKDTALVMVIAVEDVMKLASSAVQRDFSMTPFLVAAVFYFVMNTLVVFGMRKIEATLNYYR